MNVSFFQELLNSISERGRKLLDRSGGAVSVSEAEKLALALLSVRGEASGVAIAGQILDAYSSLDDDAKSTFFRFLLERLGPDIETITARAQAFARNPSGATLEPLRHAVESPREEFFRRLNLAPGATARIVAMREDLIERLPEMPELEPIDADLMHLLVTWFNRGFLVLRRIDWSTPASILEKIIEYEAVHEIRGWDDLRRRLDPRDRRCYGFFHPSLVDEPLIFVEVALTREAPVSIQSLLSAEPGKETGAAPNTAVFYSISNCQRGLRGISFGNFLIKQVANDLAKEIPSLKTFVTLSPVPRFAAWLVRLKAEAGDGGLLSEEDRIALDALDDPGWAAHAGVQETLKSILPPLAAHYFLRAKTRGGKPVDPVARFHLGNGARLERINWLGDKSARGLRQSHGLMVNYLYDLKDIEKNHEAYVNDGEVIASRAVRSLLKGADKGKAVANLAAADE